MNEQNIFAPLNKLLSEYSSLSRNFAPFLSAQSQSFKNIDAILNALSEILCTESYTIRIAQLFSPLLLELLTRASCFPDNDSVDGYTKHELFCIALSKLLWKFPEVERFAKKYFENSRNLFWRFEREVQEPPAKKIKTEVPHISQLLQAAYIFLIFEEKYFKDSWSWSVIAHFLNSENVRCRWYAHQCLRLIGKMSDKDFNILLENKFSPMEIIAYSKELSDLSSLWSLKGFSKGPLPVLGDSNKSLKEFLSSDVVDMFGVLLPKYQEVELTGERIVIVPSVRQTLHSLALAVAASEPVLLQGPVGCGKTLVIDYLAKETGRIRFENYFKVQLGDHMDSKTLLGTHCCTDVPGEFLWKPGILVKAMSEGHWLLLEDVDSAPMDVVSLLVPVLQSRSILLPGHAAPLQAAPGFQLFATQRLFRGQEGSYSEFRNNAALLSKQWRKIIMDPLTKTEIGSVILSKWSKYEPIMGRILEVYSIFSSDVKESFEVEHQAHNLHHGRLTSMRDLFKFCDRIAKDFDASSNEMALRCFQDALDCFCDNIPNIETKIELAKSVSVKFNLPKEKAGFFYQCYRPALENGDNVIIGRAKMLKKTKQISFTRSVKSTFANTRQASCLLEKVAVSIINEEPVLLVGETGTGKTSVVQHLSESINQKLTVINMSQQSDSIDLLGGYKPMDISFAIQPIKQEFEELFQFCMNKDRNDKFIKHISSQYNRKSYKILLDLMSHAMDQVIKFLLSKNTAKHLELVGRWRKFGEKVQCLKKHKFDSTAPIAFKFIEGALVKAMKNGEWLLLDEINLAEAETLECLSGVLEKDDNTLLLLDKGDTEPIYRHPDFRLFACMNPATDIGKKELPAGIRSRFTEYFVDELSEKNDLTILVEEYLKGLSLKVDTIENIVKFYLDIKKMATEKLNDGTGHHPHYSLRTLCRALSYAASNPCHNVPRSLYEAFCLSFLSQLDNPSHKIVTDIIKEKILGQKQLSILHQSIPEPKGGNHVNVSGYWIRAGKQEIEKPEDYIFTDTVKRNLHDLARIVSAGTYPVLLQGETSSGKTSLIQYLAKITGNHCVRVNNHEHTDIQEYVGTYAADVTGKLVFKEGILVEAMRKGSWIILDELNLAPTEVMEALNRVLDDNRELFIAETQTLVKAHRGFMIFATQNPAGIYGGRKILSRAFRNRFIELHFNEIPPPELETILEQKCQLPPSYSKQLVAVMQELQLRRRESGVFAGKQGFITLRDLFRWGERYVHAPDPPTKYYDWNQHLSDEGYLLLAGRVRFREEVDVIKTVIEKHFKREIVPDNLFNLTEDTSFVTKSLLERFLSEKLPPPFDHIVWTYGMRRLGVLVGKAMQFEEPVLLVGNTGCGKTTICQIYALLIQQEINIVNCHMHSESADFIGGLRPVRNSNKEDSKLFEWVDGPLIKAMKNGHFFLADEISLADDSVLERLNSVLESEQKILLSEKSYEDCKESEIKAVFGFQFFATMNPGGDYGKKELSPALRNRFTEIWCPNSAQVDSDVIAIINHSLKNSYKYNPKRFNIAKAIVDFINFYRQTDIGRRVSFTLRDILTWIEFIKSSCHALTYEAAYLMGGILVFLDSLGSGPSAMSGENTCLLVKQECLKFMENQIGRLERVNYWELIMPDYYDEEFRKIQIEISSSETQSLFGIGPFQIEMGPYQDPESTFTYNLDTATPKINAMRILRAMQLTKPILLEGNPGVGKSSLVSALAKAAGYQLVRINLSEQTDISDLFGADLPVEGGAVGEFAWHDGPLLQALRKGHWILLDEMNLASQSVLEGLNACLDHRREIYISELGMTFSLENTNTRIFGCQNPYRQGGSRKGLPRSFLNRFTQVYVEPMNPIDMRNITAAAYQNIPDDLINLMNRFNLEMNQEVSVNKKFGQRGSPWEFNLRDLLRWCEVMDQHQVEEYNVGEYVKLIYADRMRSEDDKNKVYGLFMTVASKFPDTSGQSIVDSFFELNVFENIIQLGHSTIKRKSRSWSDTNMICVANKQLPILESLMKCIEMNWMPILVGSSASGKSTLVRFLADLSGNTLHVLSVNSEMDTIELLGGFEQVDINRKIESVAQDLDTVAQESFTFYMLRDDGDKTDNCIMVKEILTHMYFLSTIEGNANDQTSYKRILTGLVNVIDFFKKVPLEETNPILRKCKKTVQKLLKKVDSEDALSGGQFEWVDSVLVHAVSKGHWLLIDDANFCSPSVLDRLNGLLEPNGVLSLSEQGSLQGELRIIKPHPDFRIFLTMNPQNGEISRAMRNRGIEIYVEPLYTKTSHGESIMDDWRFRLDIAAFSQCKNFSHSGVVFALMHLHMILDKDKSLGVSVSDFYNASSLCAQLLLKYDDPREAILKVFEFVYCKNLSTTQMNTKTLELCKDGIKSLRDILPDLQIPVINLLPTSVDYRQNCVMACFKKQIFPFVYILHEFQFHVDNVGDNSSSVNQFGSVYPTIQYANSTNTELKFQTILYLLFQSCPVSLLQFFKAWVFQTIESKMQQESNDSKIKIIFASCLRFLEILMIETEKPIALRLKKLIGDMFNYAAFTDVKEKELPMDPRWKPYIFGKFLRHMKQRPNYDDNESILEEKITSCANKYHLSLLLRLMQLKLANSDKDRSTLFKLCQTGEISNIIEDNKAYKFNVISKFRDCLLTIINTVTKMVEDDLPVICDESFWKLYEIILLLSSCLQIGETPLDKKFFLRSIDFEMKRLIPNFHSLKKKILRLFESNDGFKSNNRLLNQFNTINRALNASDKDNTICVKVANKIGFPLSFISEKEFRLWTSLQEIFSAIYLVDRIQDPNLSLKDLKLIVTNQENWAISLVKVLLRNPAHRYQKDGMQKILKILDPDYSKELNVVEDIKLQLHEAGLINIDNDDIMEICQNAPAVPTMSDKELAYRIQLYPLWEYLMILCEADILSNSNLSVQNFIVTAAVQLLGLNPKRCLQIFRTIRGNLEEKYAFDMNQFLYYTRHGFSSNALECLQFSHEEAFNKSNKDADHVSTNNIWNKNYSWAKQAPLLTYICSSLYAIPTDSVSLMCHSSLGNSKLVDVQLEVTKRVLWGNFDKLTDTKQSFLLTSANIVITWFNNLVMYIAKMADFEEEFDATSKSDVTAMFEKLGITSLFVTEKGNNLVTLALDSVFSLKKSMKVFNGSNLTQLVSTSYVLVGMLTLALFTPKNSVDPVLKHKLKYDQVYNRTRDLQCEIVSLEWITKVSCGQDFSEITHAYGHPYIKGLKKTFGFLQRKVDILNKKIRLRHQKDEYEAIKEEIGDFLSVESFDSLLSAVSQLNKFDSTLSDEKKCDVINSIQRIDNYIKNQQEIVSRLSKKYPLYEDITEPFCLGVEQVMYGLQMLSQLVLRKEYCTKLNLKFNNLSEFLKQFVPFFNLTLNPIDITAELLKENNLDTFTNILSLCNLPFAISSKLMLKLLKSAILELMNSAKLVKIQSEENLRKIVDLLLVAFTKIWKVWNHQDVQNKLKKEEDESLYISKTTTYENEPSDEEILEQNLKKYFPSFEQDYAGCISSDDFDSSHMKENTEKISEDFQLTMEDMYEISQLYCSAMSILMPVSLIEGQANSINKNFENSDFVNPQLLRHEVLYNIVRCLGDKIDSSLDSELAPGLLLMSHKLQSSLVFKAQTFDVYRDPNPAEVMNLYPVFSHLEARSKQLMKEHGDNPHLDEIIKLVERILSFPITDPVMKFVLGLEMLIEPIRLWNQFVPSKFSLHDVKEQIVKNIIHYRTMELSGWRESLDSVLRKQKVNCSKWWFHMFNILQSSKNSGDNEIETVINVLKQCLEDAPLGQFPERLNILHSFLLQKRLQHSFFKKSDRTEEVLFNIYTFYKQFLPEVNKKISDIRSPIEKEIKEFVKISRWGDVNEIAVKRSSEKSHRCIVKHMKQFEDALQTPAKRSFTLPSKSVSESADKWSLDINEKDFISASAGKESLEVFNSYTEPIIREMPHYYQKTKKLSKKLSKDLTVLSHINTLNEFCGTIAETMEGVALDMQKKICTRSQEKKQALLNIQKKKQLLSTLFKSLRVIGLSYRRGITFENTRNKNDTITIPAFDIAHMKMLKIDNEFYKTLRNVSQDVDHYFYKCVAQHSLVKMCMQSPNKNLTLDIIHRIQGYGGDLMSYVLSQRTQLVKMSSDVDKIGLFLQTVDFVKEDSLLEENKKLVLLPPEKDACQLDNTICDLLNKYLSAIKRFGAIMNCAPESSSDVPIKCQMDPYSKPSLFSSFEKSDQGWNYVMNNINECLHSTEEQINQLSTKKNRAVLSTWNQSSIIFELLKVLDRSLNNFISKISSAKFDYNQTFLKSFTELRSKIVEVYQKWSAVKAECTIKTPSECDTDELNLTSVIQKLVKEMLLGYQDLITLCAENAQDDSPGDDVVPENLFSVKISKCISDVEESLRVKSVLQLMSKLKKKIQHSQDSPDNLKKINRCVKLLKDLSPFINQYFQLVKVCFACEIGMHRTSCKLLSILLSIFENLATKGFCIPEDLEEEAEKSGGTKFEDIESGGLGEGEGTKDVSDKIETEDQLEDAIKEGQEKEKKEDESDIKEEDKGIEMSDDFEGKSYDPEKGEEPENSDDDDEDNEELEKKMGDVNDDDAEKLDEKVWGSDSEEENEEMDDDEDTGGKSQNKQSELAAKDGKDREDDTSSTQDDKSKDQLEDMGNEDEYQGEVPDPLIDAPPDKEPEYVEIPDDLEIKDDDDVKDVSASNDEEDMMEEDMSESHDETKSDGEQDASENEEAEMSQNQDEAEDESKNDEEKNHSAEPYEGEDEADDDETTKDDARLPSYPPTAETEIQPSLDQNKNSADPVQTSEMDWESGSKQTDEQHQEGDAESKNAAEQGASHEGKKSSSIKQKGGDDLQPKQKPKSSDDRTVDENAEEENIKRRPIVDKQSQQISEGDQGEESDEAGAYEHISKEEDEGTTQAVDLATKEQAAIKAVNVEYDDESESEQEVIELSSSDDEEVPVKPKGESFKRSQQQQQPGERGDAYEDEQMDTLEGDVVQTLGVPRGLESSIYTQYELWSSLSQKHILEKRSILEKDLDLFASSSIENNDRNAINQWRKYEEIVCNLSQELCEQLRLVLEPTKMSKLKGDYRTGKRLNMRKIIPYIASQFRKDKIWLRRTKPSKRQYQIMLAVDDSSSMADNHSKQLTFETLSALGQSLSLLEAGELGVVSFGEKVELLLGFHETFDTDTGAKLFQKFSFSQKKTNIPQLLQQVTSAMLQARHTGADIPKETAQLLVILSDGRGIFSAGENEVRQAVRRARNHNIFMVFVIIDSPLNKDSILDIKSTSFGKDGVEFKPYIETFPFPFYIILREIASLPVVLGEALRQWFELVTSAER
ncbi:midasin [Parasteatoda tepidariorum]|uniref:midasin n=1 Tax=Parasteatoda tepidariorum TaxID=114398 RepID=UPI001C71AB51|nr:midasin isoform X1 [Parasteatoda tepidariorum]